MYFIVSIIRTIRRILSSPSLAQAKSISTDGGFTSQDEVRREVSSDKRDDWHLIATGFLIGTFVSAIVVEPAVRSVFGQTLFTILNIGLYLGIVGAIVMDRSYVQETGQWETRYYLWIPAIFLFPIALLPYLYLRKRAFESSETASNSTAQETHAAGDPASEAQTAPTHSSRESRSESSSGDLKKQSSAASTERDETIVSASDFTDGPLRVAEFTGGVIDTTYLVGGPLDLSLFTGDAFEGLGDTEPQSRESPRAEPPDSTEQNETERDSTETPPAATETTADTDTESELESESVSTTNTESDPDPDSIEKRMKQLQHDDLVKQREAAEELLVISEHNPQDLNIDIKTLVAVFNAAEDTALRTSLVGILGSLGTSEAEKALENARVDPDPAVSKQAIEELNRSQQP